MGVGEAESSSIANKAAIVAGEVHSASGCTRRQEQHHQQMKMLSLLEKSTAHMMGVGDAGSSIISKI